MIRRFLLISFVIALPLITAVAQQKPDFSGTWKLNVAKSEFGMLPPPTSRTDVVKHKEPSISVDVTQESAEGKQQYTVNYTTDGKEVVNQMGPREVKSAAKWSDNTLTISSKFNYNGADVNAELSWTLSSDGKVRTVNIHYESAMGNTDQKFVFEKQESGAAPAPSPAKTPQ